MPWCSWFLFSLSLCCDKLNQANIFAMPFTAKFAPFQCDQLLNAAQIGRADEVVALVAEGADIEYKDTVRSSVCFCHLCSARDFFFQSILIFKVS